MDLKIEPQTVQIQAENKLRDAILSGFFKPGQRLTEATLCEMMQVSRTSVREALRRLEAEKLITTTPSRGPSVAEIAWEEAKEIYDVRAILEGEAAALSADGGPWNTISLYDLRSLPLQHFLESVSSRGGPMTGSASEAIDRWLYELLSAHPKRQQ